MICYGHLAHEKRGLIIAVAMPGVQLQTFTTILYRVRHHANAAMTLDMFMKPRPSRSMFSTIERHERLNEDGVTRNNIQHRI